MDIALIIGNDTIQTVLENGDLVADEGIETAVLISLFTDHRVTESELPPDTTDKKGWWGDMFPQVNNDQIGSKLWTLSRSKVTEQTLAAVETFAIDALQWMIEDGVATNIEATAEMDDLRRIGLSVTIKRPAGNQNRFNLIWDQQELIRA